MRREYSGEEIAQVYDVSRQYISTVLKRALTKAFINYKENNPYLTDFEAAAHLMEDLQIDINKKNLKCFPPKIRKSIEKSAIIYMIENNISITV